MTRLAVALALLLVPSLAHAQSIDDRSPRVAANLALGFGGELDAYTNFESSAIPDQHGDTDLDPSIGFDLRGEIPVLDFLVVGGQFEFLSYLIDATDAEREETFSFDAYVRARWVFEAVADTLFIEPYLMIPLGFTMAVLPDPDGSGDEIWPGWNTAALLGCQILHGSGFGGFVELGWRHAEAYTSRDVILIGQADLSLVLNEMALNVGFVYAFGS